MHWLELDPSSGAVLQEGLYGYTGDYVYAGDISANANGDAVLVFELSGGTFGVGVWVSGRQSSDAPNTLRWPVAVKYGEGCYERPPYNTVGLHSAVDLDARDGVFWVAGAYTKGANSNCQYNDWAVAVGAATFSAPTASASTSSALGAKTTVHPPSKGLRSAGLRADSALKPIHPPVPLGGRQP